MSGSGEEMGSTLFGKYKVEKILGHGAFAKVYHARNVKTGQSVAIKVISKKKTDRFTDHAVIKREISIMRRLRHPYIVRLFEVLATTAKIYFVMEYAQGGELFSKIARGRFSEDLSRRYFQQLITAVRFYHARGVYHRDLKPENLLLDENWNLKVTDFGLSAVKEQVKSDGRLHTLCGTPAYVAPEILANKGYDGAKADVWSCGVILFVLNAGYLPFSDRNLMNMYRKIYNGVFKCPKWMSTEMKRFLSRVLDPNPDSRITVEQIISDPWFMIGYNEVKCSSEEEFDIHGGDNPYLNAFNLISFSSGADISGLLNQPETVSRERFVSAESPEAIVTRVADAAAGEGIIVTKKEWGVRMEGEDCNFVAAVEIHRLTEELVVVEVVTREGHDECCGGQKIWKDKIRPDLLTLVYEPEGTTVHN